MLIRVGDVARALGESETTIRYWSDKFRVRPRRHGGQRNYSSNHIALLALVQGMLRTEGYTIAGAKKKLGIT